MALATSSFPVPLSPVMITEESAGATFSTSFSTFFKGFTLTHDIFHIHQTGHMLLQVLIFSLQGHLGGCITDQVRKIVRIKRFGHIVECTLLQVPAQQYRPMQMQS